MPMVLVSTPRKGNSMSDYEMLMIVLTIIGLVLISNNQKITIQL
jgi:hypothetical protein